MTVSALILAGGKATRFGGRAKHAIEIDGETIFARQVRVLAPRVGEILVSAQTEIAGYRTVRDADEAAGAGPLAGIAAGLAACATEWLLVVACDMPRLTGDVIDALLALRAPENSAIDAICARIGGRPEPLLSVLHARARTVVEHRLTAGRLRASELFTAGELRVAYLDDPDPRALVNINSPEDLRES